MGTTAFSISGLHTTCLAPCHTATPFTSLGGDKTRGGGHKLPHLLLDVTLAVLRGKTNFDITQNAEASLQQLATKSRVVIELETATFRKTLRP